MPSLVRTNRLPKRHRRGGDDHNIAYHDEDEEDSHEDDDDVVIVYGETAAQDDHADSPQSIAQNEKHANDYNSSNNTQQQQEKQWMARRQERRQQHRRRNNNKQEEVENDWNNISEYHVYSEDDEDSFYFRHRHKNFKPQEESPKENDPFDSLRSMMADTSQEKRRGGSEAPVVHDENQPLSQQQDQQEEDHHDGSMAPESNKVLSQVMAETRPLEPSPPDFDMGFHNDTDSDEPEEEKTVPFPSNTDSRKRNKSGPVVQQSASKQARLGGGETTNQRFHALKNRKPSSLFGTHKQRKEVSTVVNVVKSSSTSVVGLRPANWSSSRGRSASPKRSKNTQSQSLAKMSALAAATRRPFRSSKTLGKSKASEPLHKTTATAASPKRRQSLDISFAPSFVPKTKSPTRDTSSDALVEDPADEEETNVTTAINNNAVLRTGATSAIAFSPPPRRSQKGAIGKWGSRMASIRNARSSASVKLHNKAYARHSVGGGLDLNNPRKQAKNHVEVTVLDGQIVKESLLCVPDDRTITVLVFVHNHVVHKHTHGSGKRIGQAPQESIVVQQDRLAWCTFRPATARVIHLEGGCQLKLYDVVVLPCPPSNEIELPESLLRDEVEPKATL